MSLHHEDDKLIVFERGTLLWVFNFHTTKSFADYRIGAGTAGKYPLSKKVAIVFTFRVECIFRASLRNKGRRRLEITIGRVCDPRPSFREPGNKLNQN